MPPGYLEILSKNSNIPCNTLFAHERELIFTFVFVLWGKDVTLVNYLSKILQKALKV